MAREVDVVVVGAGIAGVSTAFHLARSGLRVALCDGRAPLSLTSDKSTECYRNWWPGPGDDMVTFMNRSIDLLERYAVESGDIFNLNRRGYLFATNDPTRLETMISTAEEISSFGAGGLRFHSRQADDYRPSPPRGYQGVAPGVDIFTDGATLNHHHPYLTDETVGAVHVRRAGWFSAQQLGSWMLDETRRRGAVMVASAVTGIGTQGGRVSSVTLADGSELTAGAVVNCAGPLAPRVAAMVGETLPVFSELHLKVGFRDSLQAIPRDAPMIIWNDPQRLDWSEDERQALADSGRDDLLGEMPPSCHGRPEGGDESPWVLALWEYHRTVMEPIWPIPTDEVYPEAVIRGLTRMVPALGGYHVRLPHSVVDGGYYTKTAENRLLVGTTSTPGMFTVAALSGYGVMAACAAGELVSLHITGRPLPSYAPALAPSRYADPVYVERMRAQSDAGQI